MESSNSKNFEYSFDVASFPEGLKVAGVPKYHGGVSDFIDEYFQKFEPLMKDKDFILKPYTKICVWSSLLGKKRANSWESGDRIFGCFVNSTENLPEGIVCADTGIKKFLVMTVRGKTWEDCDAVAFPADKFRELMPDEYRDALYPPIKEVNWHFEISADENFYMSYIETDDDINISPDVVIHERKYFAPLMY